MHLFFVRTTLAPAFGWSQLAATRFVWLAAVVVAVGQLVITYLPPMQALLGPKALTLGQGLWIIAADLLVRALLELDRQAQHLFKRPKREMMQSLQHQPRVIPCGR